MRQSALFCLILLMGAGCEQSRNGHVVVYTSQDQVYAEPILQEFMKETGIEVRAVYDGESVKTVGLANRLRAEKAHPQCDVFWNNEALLTCALAADGVILAKAWQEVGARTRRLIYNTNFVKSADLPCSLLELTNVQWRKRVAIAYPMFGTTAAHFTSLRQKWGDATWRKWCQGLVANEAFVVDGNSVAANLVGKGEAWLGLTDSDDIAAAQREGNPVAAAPISSEFLAIPNTIAIVENAPHREHAAKLAHYLRRETTVQKLIQARALESAQPDPGVACTNWGELASALEPTRAELKKLFLR